MEAKTPAQRKKYEEEHRDFLLSEMILAAMQEDDISRTLYRECEVNQKIS